jgi:type I restriction enzyme M protein
MAKRKSYQVAEENIKKEGVQDYLTGEWVRAGVTEHKEAVNVFTKKLIEDLGYSKKQIQTIPQFRVKVSPSGQEKYPVDITVFNDERKNYENVFMLVECKQPERKDGRRQLDIYLNLVPSVEIGVWFNGKEHLYLWKVRNTKTDRWEWKEIPELPKRGQRIEDIGLYKRKDLTKPKNLKVVFNDIRNHLAGNITGITRDEAIAQEIINLLFCKIYDEINTSFDEQVTFRVGIDEPREEVKKRISKLFEKVIQEYDDVFDSNDRIKLDADSIVYIVGELQRFAITEAERDAIGDAFEVFIGPTLRGGEGQFFTPRNVVKMAIEILDPKIGEYIIDPACGSGGFLIVALEYIWKKLEEEAKRKGWSKELLGSKRKEIASKFIAGIDKDSFLAKVTKAYMAIVGDGRGGIFCENSLLPFSDWNPKTKQKIELGKFDVLVTNPPFGAKIPVRGERILEQYDLGFKWKYNKENKVYEKTTELYDKQPPQILFIERCLQFLKNGGRMAIILPETYLHAKNSEHILQFLEKYKILYVVDLSHDTFRPHNNAKTVVVVLEKSKPTANQQIYFSIAKTVGHDHTGRVLYKIDPKTNKRTDEIDDDIPSIIKQLQEFRKTSKLTPNPLLFSKKYEEINKKVFVPRYYWRDYQKDLQKYAENNKCILIPFGELQQRNIIKVFEGHGSPDAVFKGSGTIPYVRVADIINLEVYKNPTALIPEDIYIKKKGKGIDLEIGDLLFVRRGSYRIGSIALISPFDKKILLTKEILVFRVNKKSNEFDITPYYLAYLLINPIVQKQIDDKVLIETTLPNISDRWKELILPIHKDRETRVKISKKIQNVFELKWKAVEQINRLQDGKFD